MKRGNRNAAMKANARVTALRLILVIAVPALILEGCAASRAYNQGMRSMRAERYEEAIRSLQEAAARNPDNPKYRIALSDALIKSGDAHITRGQAFQHAGDLELAYREFNTAFMENPMNDRAAELRNQVNKELLARAAPEKTPKEPPIQSPLVPLAGKPVNLKMSDAEIKEVFNSMEKLTGVTFIYDQEFKGGKITVNFQNLSFKDVLDRLMLMNHMFYRPIDSHTILIANDTDAKRAEYEEQVLKTFYLHNADPAAVTAGLKSIVDLKRVLVDPVLKSITIKDSPTKVELARRLIEREDMRRAEVVVDMEILEFNRDRLRQYGLDFSSYAVGAAASLEPTTSFPSGTLIRGHMLGNLDMSDILFSIPTVVYRLLRTDSRTHLIARPQIRTVADKTATVKIGERIPIPVTTYVPVAGGGINNQPITSFQMTDIGLSVDITPEVHLDNEVTLGVKFEVSSVVREGTTYQPPTLGTRSVSSTIRLKDGEMTVIAGLIRDEERRSTSGFPGLSNVPILGRLLSASQDSGTQTDVVITLEPHIVRMAEVGEEERKPVWVGTEHRLQVSDEPPPFARTSEEPEPATEQPSPNPAAPASSPTPNASEPETQPTPAARCILLMDPMDVVVPVGEQFAMGITAESETPLSHASFDLVFDPSMLAVAEVRAGEALKRTFKSDVLPGRVRIEFDAPSKFDGKICTVVFDSKAAGSARLVIDDARALDSQKNPVTVTFVPAAVKVARDDNPI